MLLSPYLAGLLQEVGAAVSDGRGEEADGEEVGGLGERAHDWRETASDRRERVREAGVQAGGRADSRL